MDVFIKVVGVGGGGISAVNHMYSSGMGGKTGTGAAPVVAEIARGLGIFLTIGVVTRPFEFEGAEPALRAREGIDRLTGRVNTLVLISDERLRYLMPTLTPANAFAAADEMLRRVVQGLSDPLAVPCWVNLDFHDLLYFMQGPGVAYAALGRGSGEGCIAEAMQQAASALLEAPLAGARKLILSFRVRQTTGLGGIEETIKMLDARHKKEPDIVWGVCQDERLGDDAQLVLIGTDFEQAAGPAAAARPPLPDAAAH